MRWLAWLLFGFKGRIPRKWYWLGQAMLFGVGVAVTFAMHRGKWPGPEDVKLTPAELLVNVPFLVPAFALARKRLNDRGYSLWVTLLWLVVGIASLVIGYSGPLKDPTHLSHGHKVALAILIVPSLWFFVDLFLLRGEPGTNRYGADPLAGNQQAPPRRGRTIGENLRDGITALAAVIALLTLSIPSISIQRVIQPVFSRLFLSSAISKDMEIWRERKTNKPATAAHEAALAARKAGDDDSAMRHYARAIELFGEDNPTAALTYGSRGVAYEQMGRDDKALADYGKAIAVNPSHLAAYRQRAVLLRKLGRYDEALKDFDWLVENELLASSAHVDRGYTFEKAGRPNDALNAYAEAMDAAHSHYDWMIWTSKTLDRFMPEEAKERQKDLVASITKSRDDLIATAHVRRGNVFRGLNEIDKALQEYSKAETLNLEQASLYSNRGWLYERQGEIAKARADYEKAATLMTPDDWLKRALERTEPQSSP